MDSLQNVIKPAKPAPAEGGVHGDEASTLQCFFVGNLLLLHNFEDTTETLEVEVVYSLLLFLTVRYQFMF